MLNQQLLDYIKQSLATGVNREEIRSSLLGVGWQEMDIDEAMKSFNTGHEGIFVPTQKIEPAIVQKSGLISKVMIGVILLVVIILIVIGGYFYFHR